MLSATLDQLGPGPWTEQDYFDLGETLLRIELIDGSLLVSPPPGVRHQHVSLQLAMAFDGAARSAGLSVYPAVNVRLASDRIVIPDIVLADTDDEGFAIEAAEVKLICETVDSSSVVADHVIKLRLYADAGIPCYLLAESAATDLVLRLFQLRSGDYVQVAEGRIGEMLCLTEPISLDLPVDQIASPLATPRDRS